MPRPEPPAAARRHPVIPIHAASVQPDPAAAAAGSDCSGSEPFALRVLGASMAPEFADGDIVIIEPDGPLHDGSFVLLALPDEGWVLRRLHCAPDGPAGAGGLVDGDAGGATGGAAGRGWFVEVLDGSRAPRPLHDLQAIAGVVIQRARPGRRRETRWYGRNTGATR